MSLSWESTLQWLCFIPFGKALDSSDLVLGYMIIDIDALRENHKASCIILYYIEKGLAVFLKPSHSSFIPLSLLLRPPSFVLPHLQLDLCAFHSFTAYRDHSLFTEQETLLLLQFLLYFIPKTESESSGSRCVSQSLFSFSLRVHWPPPWKLENGMPMATKATVMAMATAMTMAMVTTMSAS